MASLKLIYY